MKFGQDKITKLQKTSSTVVTLPSGSLISIGGRRKVLNSNLTLSTGTIGLGGLESAVANLTFYYVYAVLSGGSVNLIASTSFQKPSAYSAYKKVGAFYTDGSSNVFKTFYNGEKNNIEYTVTFNTINNVVITQNPVNWVDSISDNGIGASRINHGGVFALSPEGLCSVTNTNQAYRMSLSMGQPFTDLGVRNASDAFADAQVTVKCIARDVEATIIDWNNY